MTPKRRRLWLLLGSLGAVAGALALVLVALNDSLVFFYSPSQIAEKAPAPGKRVRIGGLVAPGSLQKAGGDVSFEVTDGAKTVKAVYRGVLPDLFREGQGVVAEGSLREDGVFAAREVLAKHDETYMPREVIEALKKTGQYRDPAEKKK
jgi:cytochrome c-type biogenesis protein CcmE